MRTYHLLLKNGTGKKGFLVANDILRERVWKCGNDYVFECEVENIEEEITPLAKQIRRMRKEEEKVSFTVFD